MDISLVTHGHRLTPHHWLIGNLVVYVPSSLSSSSSSSSTKQQSSDRVVATVTCREHFCASLNNQWLAYASPDGSVCVVRDNQVLTAILERVDPVIRIDYVDNTTGAVWFCVQHGAAWQRWVWAWNHPVKTATQANLIRGPDVTPEYKQRVFTAREDLTKLASVYAYRKAPNEYWIHNDQARQPDMRIEFEPTWYDLATSSFMTLDSDDDEDDEDEEEETKSVSIQDDDSVTMPATRTTTVDAEAEVSRRTEEEVSPPPQEDVPEENEEAEKEEEDEEEEEEEEEAEMLPA